MYQTSPAAPLATDISCQQPIWKQPLKTVDVRPASGNVVRPARPITRSGPFPYVDSDAEADPDQPATAQGGLQDGDVPDALPSSAYVIVYPEGPGAVNLTAQHVHIRKTVRDALPRLEAKLVFDAAFPDTVSLARDIHRALVDVAGELGYPGLQEALRVDHGVNAAISAIVRQRMSTYRSTIKKAADTHAAAYYQLKAGCGAFVNALFDHLSYSYVFTKDATTDKLNVSWNTPYGHEIFHAMLQSCFFNGSSSLAVKYLERFTSSLDLHPEEKEIPIPMLALVGTAIHASLTEWRSGTRGHVNFSADAFIDVYNEHSLILTGIKDKNLRGFHKMMHRLYREASGAAPATNNAAAAAANNALSHIDFANMDID